MISLFQLGFEWTPFTIKLDFLSLVPASALWLAISNKQKIDTIYDNGGESADRYTLIDEDGDMSADGQIEGAKVNASSVANGYYLGGTQFANASSGDFYFGNTAADTILQGTTVNLDSSGDITLDAAGDQVYFKKNGVTNLTIGTNNGSITASGDISASGTVTVGTSGDASALHVYGRIYTHGSLVEIGDGHITASGNISGSTNSTASFAHIITTGETIEFKSGNTKLGQLKFDANEGFQAQTADGKQKPSRTGLNLFLTQSQTTVGTNAEGDIVKFGGDTVTAGKLYALVDGTWSEPDQRNYTATSSLAVAIGTNSTTEGMLLRGMVKLASDPGCGIGRPVYLYTTGNTSCVPPTSNAIARVVGHYMSGSGTIYFNPDNTWVEL